MGELNVEPDVIELCLGHASGLRRGVAGTYNRSLRLVERRVAMEAWSTHLLSLTSPNVVPIRSRKG
jgi:hypothetical protein